MVLTKTWFMFQRIIGIARWTLWHSQGSPGTRPEIGQDSDASSVTHSKSLPYMYLAMLSIYTRIHVHIYTQKHGFDKDMIHVSTHGHCQVNIVTLTGVSRHAPRNRQRFGCLRCERTEISWYRSCISTCVDVNGMLVCMHTLILHEYVSMYAHTHDLDAWYVRVPRSRDTDPASVRV
jgi:hypothetical protein